MEGPTGVVTRDVKEAHCQVCKHTWIIRSKKDQSCPECRRKSSSVTKTSKTRCLCISCHHVWIVDAFPKEATCLKCGKKNEEGKKKEISFDFVTEYVCGSCGSTWIKGLSLDNKTQFCRECGCGREEALEADRKKEHKQRFGGGGISSYQGHPQTWNDDTHEWEPSKEEIDAKIATGIWKKPLPMIVMM